MNKSLSLIIVLTLTTTLSGGVLSFFNLFTAPRIEEYRREKLRQSIKLVLPGIAGYEEEVIGKKVFYLGKDENGTAKSVAFKAVGNGFQGKIRLLMGTDLKMQKIFAIEILGQKETPGLGTKIVEDTTNKEDPGWFINQFEGMEVESRTIRYIKNQKASGPAEVEAITGATISSKAVVGIINQALKENRKVFVEREHQLED